MVAHHIDIVGVVGSSPASPTIKRGLITSFLLLNYKLSASVRCEFFGKYSYRFSGQLRWEFLGEVA